MRLAPMILLAPTLALHAAAPARADFPRGPGGAPVLGDAFDGSRLDPAFSERRPEVFSTRIAGGALAMTLDVRALWAGDQQAALLAKRVRGDFRVTAAVRVRKTSVPTAPPDPRVRLGGLMARDPAGGGGGAPENYVHIVVGFTPESIGVETKTTVDSRTTFAASPSPTADADVRICRVGPTFTLLKRPLGASAWEPAATYERPDLPTELEVGPNLYSVFERPDVTATFDAVHYEAIARTADCAIDDRRAPAASRVRLSPSGRRLALRTSEDARVEILVGGRRLTTGPVRGGGAGTLRLARRLGRRPTLVRLRLTDAAGNLGRRSVRLAR